MKIAIVRERDGETRVAATPETVGKLIGLGNTVAIESGAGKLSSIPDDQYAAAGASVTGTAAEAVSGADIVLTVRRPDALALRGVNPGALVIGGMDPYGNEAALSALASTGVSLFAMEFMPRITRAQVMDILSSQANLAGYQAVIEAAAVFDRGIPMMMTAAGTVRPAKAFIMGAGVAGLQAIATARRLGAVVSANDVRPAAKEQVESLGGKFIAVEDEEFKQAETAGGYAKQMSAEYQAKQAELTASHVAKQDIVITTALIPGRPAPRLITRAMVESMGPGSVIVDLAAERGGNVELTVPGQVVEHNGVKIVGYLNLAGRIPTTASQLYSRNLLAFVETMFDKKAKTFAINWDDDLVKATLLTRNGAVVHPNFAGAAAAPIAPIAPVAPAAPAMAAVPTPASPQVAADAARVHVGDATVASDNRAGPADEPQQTGALDGPVAFVPPGTPDAGAAPARRRRTPAAGSETEEAAAKPRTPRVRKPAGETPGNSGDVE